MQKTKGRFGKILSFTVAAVMAISCLSVSAFAETPQEIKKGSYTVDAELSCFVNAMGGIEFGDGILTGASVNVDESGNASMTLHMSKSEVTIYSVKAYTFIDNTASDLGYYNDEGELVKEGVTYTLSSDTAPNASNEQINYVDSMTFPLTSYKDSYNLYMYLNSQVMGVQFCDGNGSGASNNPDVATPYKAELTVDWNSLSKGTAVNEVKASETKTQSAEVIYNVEGGYEVSIPSSITVDAATKTGEYTVEAKNFVIGSKAYVTVTADENGTLTSGNSSVAFTNNLAAGKLSATGDTLDGTVTVTDSVSAPGAYVGTVNFVINYFAGK